MVDIVLNLVDRLFCLLVEIYFVLGILIEFEVMGIGRINFIGRLLGVRGIRFVYFNDWGYNIIYCFCFSIFIVKWRIKF